ncbi:MAG: hypothetical protein JWN69_341, partial [Alphaproteobacteria bacterium]|nr:hypothetical protein [Alphaproteobacteria bacterium]
MSSVAEKEQKQREYQREGNVEADPEGRFSRSRNVRPPIRQHQVGDEDQQQHHEGADLEPGADYEFHWGVLSEGG